MELNTVIVGDALTVLRQLPDAFVDVTVTSPPYNKGERDKGWLVDKVIYDGAPDCKGEWIGRFRPKPLPDSHQETFAKQVTLPI